MTDNWSRNSSVNSREKQLQSIFQINLTELKNFSSGIIQTTHN